MASVSREIVGIVADVKHAGLVADPKTEVYVPMAQDTWAFGLLAIRGSRPIEALWPDIRTELAAVDPDLPLTMTPMADFVAQWLAPLEFQITLVGLFAAFALTMAALGIYGVIAYLVSMRTNEIGIRMALGAEGGTVLRQLVGRGVAPAIVGVGIGLAGAVLTTRFMASLLFGVSPTDPLIMAAVAIVLLAVGVVACYVPARRATRIDPREALRYA